MPGSRHCGLGYSSSHPIVAHRGMATYAACGGTSERSEDLDLEPRRRPPAGRGRGIASVDTVMATGELDTGGAMSASVAPVRGERSLERGSRPLADREPRACRRGLDLVVELGGHLERHQPGRSVAERRLPRPTACRPGAGGSCARHAPTWPRAQASTRRRRPRRSPARPPPGDVPSSAPASPTGNPPRTAVRSAGPRPSGRSPRSPRPAAP